MRLFPKLTIEKYYLFYYKLGTNIFMSRTKNGLIYNKKNMI